MAVTMSLEKSLCPGASSATKLWLAAPCWVARVVQVQSPTSLSQYGFGVRNKFNTCNIIDWTTFNTILQYTTIYYNFLQVFLQQYEIIFIYFMDLEWNRITGSGQFSGSPGKLPCFTPAKPLQSNPTIFNPHASNSVLEEKRIWNLCLKILLQEPNVPSSILILCMEVFHKKYQTSHKNPYRNRPPQSLVAMIVKRQRRDANLRVHHAVTIVIGVSFKNWCFFHNRHLTKPMTWRNVNVYDYGV